MTPAQQRALFLGGQLHEANETITRRARMARTATNRGGPLAAWLLRTADMVGLREELRAQLAEALAEVGRGPRHASPYWLPESAQFDGSGYQRGRHRAG
jgi:hypothetical protein